VEQLHRVPESPDTFAREVRLIVLEQSKRANVGHIGSALSIADLIAVLYSGVLRGVGEDDPERDRFVLSKGHAALALYAALHVRGVLSSDELDSFSGDGTLLGTHPERDLRGVDFTSGSLGHGLSTACGAALAARLDGSARRVFCLLSDAECNEGSTWEAAMFAGHRRLDNLTAIVDANGQQALGYTRDVLDLEPLVERWRSFGWDARDVDGHDLDACRAALEDPSREGKPRVLVARTEFGHGVSFMTSRIEWHYLPLDDEQYRRALAEVGAA
jgi:transketolase